MTAPYYQDDFVTIFQGDCREWMPEADVIVTDPPYGIAFASNQVGKFRGQSIANDDDCSVRDAVLGAWAGPALVFGSWKRPMPVGTKALLVWDKEMYGGRMGDLTIPWLNNHEFIYVIGSGFRGYRGTAVLRSQAVVSWSGKGQRLHPNEKPVDLLRDLIGKCPPGTVLDPFMGSGSTLVAAKSLGRRAIGIEIEEHYCEVAAKRCQQEVLGLSAPSSAPSLEPDDDLWAPTWLGLSPVYEGYEPKEVEATSGFEPLNRGFADLTKPVE